MLENDALLAAESAAKDEDEEEEEEEEAALETMAGGEPTIRGCDSGANTWVLLGPKHK